MNMINKCAKFHKDSPSGQKVKLSSISRERLNFRRRPFLCTTLYRNLMQASNFGGTLDQLFLCIFFMKFSQKMPLYLFYTMVLKSQKWPKTQIKGGPALVYFVFPDQCIARSSVENEIREKPPGPWQYDQINNKWLPDLCLFWGRGGQLISGEKPVLRNAAWKGAIASGVCAK